MMQYTRTTTHSSRLYPQLNVVANESLVMDFMDVQRSTKSITSLDFYCCYIHSDAIPYETNILWMKMFNASSSEAYLIFNATTLNQRMTSISSMRKCWTKRKENPRKYIFDIFFLSCVRRKFLRFRTNCIVLCPEIYSLPVVRLVQTWVHNNQYQWMNKFIVQLRSCSSSLMSHVLSYAHYSAIIVVTVDDVWWHDCHLLIQILQIA